MFRHKKSYLISIPGTDKKERAIIEDFLKNNGITAKIIHHPIDVREL